MCIPPFGELPDEPGIDRPEGQFAMLRPLARTGYVIEQPSQFAPGKVGVDDQPGTIANQLGVTGRLQLIAEFRRAPVLPDNRVV